MKAIEANLLKFLKRSPQFVIPIYQRNYSWTDEQCEQLWQDLLRAGRNKNVSAHFIGSIVYVERSLSTMTHQEALLVIDGQQRLTTSTLLIAALAEHFEKGQIGEILDTFSAKKLRNYYLVNPEEEGERHFKLILSETDKVTLLSILRNDPQPDDASQRILSNYRFFQDKIAKHQAELSEICDGLAKLVIVDVALDRSQDNPQLIFESMNSTGLELSQADLIRNFILMGLEPKLQTDLYQSYWRPMEKGFGKAAYQDHFDAFMRHYLTAKTGDIPNIRQVYSAFKSFARDFAGGTRELVVDIHRFAGYYCSMALGSESDTTLKQAFHDLRELKVDVAYPFLLDAYHDYKTAKLSRDEMHQIVRLVESYVFRRAVCGIPPSSLNKTFAGLSGLLKKDRYVESVQATLLLYPSYRRFPSDEEFLREIKIKDLYNFRSRSYWLRRLENLGRKEPVSVEAYTIEHILPQNENLSVEWQSELGPDWKVIQASYLHTLGNLTLTGYNSEYSDRLFAYKRDQIKDADGNLIGFAHSPLRLNQGLRDVQAWTEEAIKARADRLSKEALKVWTFPVLAPDILEAYRPSKSRAGQQIYRLEDHPHLDKGLMKDLFERLRHEIQQIDPCVTEEFKKLYVAYKAETNFVDVIPQAKRLCLSINLPIHQIDDPKALCSDVSERGRWGNGKVEAFISSFDEIPYAIGLIRQAFDSQMGEPQEA